MSARSQPRKHVVKGIRRSDVTGEVKDRDLSKFVSIRHAHGCQACQIRYTDTCSTPEVNGRCRVCSGAMYGRPILEISGDPRECCRVYAGPATAAQMTTYRCAGTTDWWICRRCYRTHPYDPA